MNRYKILNLIAEFLLFFAILWFLFWGVKWWHITRVIRNNQSNGRPDWDDVGIMWHYTFYLYGTMVILLIAKIFAQSKKY